MLVELSAQLSKETGVNRSSFSLSVFFRKHSSQSRIMYLPKETSTENQVEKELKSEVEEQRPVGCIYSLLQALLREMQFFTRQIGIRSIAVNGF